MTTLRARRKLVLLHELVKQRLLGPATLVAVGSARAWTRRADGSGWLEPERMIHYALHEELDVKQAEDFFAILRPAWSARPADRYYIEQGIRLGAYLFDRLYRDLHRARARRAFVDQRGPHTRS